ncbi:MAG: hypothetical protein V1778_00815, partial [bacterium]
MQRKPIIFIGLLFLAVIVVVIFGVFSRKNDHGASEKSQKHFSSRFFDLSFFFPQSFGEASEEELTKDDVDDLVSQGSGLRITFSKNPDLFILVSSDDFSVFNELPYRGEAFTTLCPHEGVRSTGEGCRRVSYNGQVMLLRSEPVVDEGVYNLVRTVSFPLVGQQYHGLKVFQSFPDVFDQLNVAATGKDREALLQSFGRDLLSG